MTGEHDGHGAQWLAAESRRLLRFAAASARPRGGFAWLDDDGRPRQDTPAYTWITCRMTHVLALGALLDEPYCAELAARGVGALAGELRDAVDGGWYHAVADGIPVAPGKHAYDHAFVVLAASSAAAAEIAGGQQLLGEALHVFAEHFLDSRGGLVVDSWDGSWRNADPYRGVNACMHAVECLLAAADVTGDASPRDRALLIAERVVHGFARQAGWLLPEHYDCDWNPVPGYNQDNPGDQFRPYGVTVGHLLEWSRLCLHLRAALRDVAPGWLLADAVALFDTAVRHGWSAEDEPGFAYTIDWDGRPVVTARLHWVAAEAIATAAALHHATADRLYADWYHRWWRHAEAFIDRDRGSWHHELDTTNKPAATIWQGKPELYHPFQATLFPRLPLAPSLATALRSGLLDTVEVP